MFNDDWSRHANQHDKFFSWFKYWFVFVAFVGVAIMGGVVWGLVELWPHIIGLIDRVGK
jgi:hypothetical protein